MSIITDKNKKILQSKGMRSKLKINPKKIKDPRPIPTLIRFLSRVLFDSFTNLHNIKPKLQVYKKNKTIDKNPMLIIFRKQKGI